MSLHVEMYLNAVFFHFTSNSSEIKAVYLSLKRVNDGYAEIKFKCNDRAEQLAKAMNGSRP